MPIYGNRIYADIIAKEQVMKELDEALSELADANLEKNPAYDLVSEKRNDIYKEVVALKNAKYYTIEEVDQYLPKEAKIDEDDVF
jgi:cell division protein FtsX